MQAQKLSPELQERSLLPYKLLGFKEKQQNKMVRCSHKLPGGIDFQTREHANKAL